MTSVPVACPVCKVPWPSEPEVLGALRACPACGREVYVALFPAFRHGPPRGVSPEPVLVEGEAACFQHPDKRAVVPCAECGRFMCALCDVELQGRHLCPSCLEAGQRKGAFTALETRRTLWDSAALLVAILPLVLCWPTTVLTAPGAIVLGIVSFYRPGSLVRRSRLRAWMAIGLGVVQIGLWMLVLLVGLSAAEE
jgi:hypothetical protein